MAKGKRIVAWAALLLLWSAPVLSQAKSPDFDGDGEVGFDDFFLFAAAFGGADARFDLDGDRQVDFDDFFLFAAAFRKAPEAGNLVQRLSDCETLTGWGRPAQLVQDARQGKFAVISPMKADGVGFLSLNYAQTGVDLSRAYALVFYWKVEGNGLRNFMVKVRNYPLAGGMEAVYPIWEAGKPPLSVGWQRAVVVLSAPLHDDWGEKPDLSARYVTFRTETEKGADVRLFVDDVLALPPILDWQMSVPRQTEGRWSATVSLHNLTGQPLSVLIGRDDQPLAHVTLPPQEQDTLAVPLPAEADPLSRLEPLESLSVRLWAEVAGVPETRTEKTAHILKIVDLPQRPRLLFSRDGIEGLKGRIQRDDWAQARWREVLRGAEQAKAGGVELPPRGGNWWGWYACPRHGAALRTGRQTGRWEWEHICPVDNEIWRGDPNDSSRDYDGCVLMGLHDRWARTVRDLGLAYQVTGDPGFAHKAREILLAYAERYLAYPLHNTRGEAKIGGGRVGPQTLDESVWIIPLCQGADLLWDALSQADREAIAQRLLLPATKEVILPHRIGVHNIQCWKNSAVGLVGFLLGDEDLIAEAIRNPDRGYGRQMREGVLSDGIWWEGAWGYHFYTLSALWGLTEAARNCGIDLYGPELKGMFDAPLKFAMPNLHLPAFNDSGEVVLLAQAALYELAFARYRDPQYLALLASSNRRNDFALYFGAEDLSAPPPVQGRSVNYPNAGYAILSRGPGEKATWLCLKYGPHGGGHGHPDKLSFVLYARGQVVSPDPGTARYGLPIQNSWYRTTLAHNTLVVDETSQKQAEGKCLAFGSEKGVDFVVAEAGDIYEGVRFIRTVALLNEDLLVFVDQVRCDKERLLDVAYHQTGRWEELPEGRTWAPPDKDGYRYFRDATTRQAGEGITSTGSVGNGWRVAVTMAGGEPADVIAATGVGAHTEDRVPVLLFRRRARETALAWGIALDGKPLRLEWLPVRDQDGNPLPLSVAAGVQVTTSDGRVWHLTTHPERRSVHVSAPDTSR